MHALLRRSPLRMFVMNALVASVAARDCGQAEVDARDITGCITVLHMNYLGHKGAVWLGDALHHNVDLEILDLHHTKIGDDDALALAAGLHNNTHLKRLQMHNNKIFDTGAAALGRALLENDSLEFLSLSSNGVGDEGAKGLAEGLRGNRALRRLDLYFNKVGDEGAIALADALRVNRGLRMLHLDTNAVGDPGGLAFAAALRGTKAGLMTSAVAPSALGELTLNYNQLTNEATDALMDAAQNHEGLHTLALDHNHMVHGATKEKLKNTHAAIMATRLALATWLVDAGLIEGGWNSAEGTPLTSDYAPSVLRLKAHRREGLLALRDMRKAQLTAHAALAHLSPERRAALAAALIAQVNKLTAHDEL